MTSEERLRRELLAAHGELIGQRELARLLGFGSVDALQKAAERKTLPVSLVRIPHRRGRFAFTRDLAAYLASLRDGTGAAAPSLPPREGR